MPSSISSPSEAPQEESGNRVNSPSDAQRFLEEQITTAADALGTRRIERIAEVGCTTNANPEAQAQVTRWEASTSLDVNSEAEANQMGSALEEALVGKKWEADLKEDDVSGEPYRVLLQATSPEGGYRLNIAHLNEYGENYVDIVMTSPCQKNPEGHQMVRSPLDPGYGRTDGGKYDVEAEKKALADGTATSAATPTTQPTHKP